MKKRKRANKTEPDSVAKQFLRAIIFGVSAGTIMLCISLSLAAVSVQRSSSEGTKVFILAVICAVCSALVTGFVTSKIMCKKGVLYGFTSSLILAFILLAISLIVSDCKITYHSIAILLTMMLGGATGGVLAVNILN